MHTNKFPKFDNKEPFSCPSEALKHAKGNPVVKRVGSVMLIALPQRGYAYLPPGFDLTVARRVRRDGRVTHVYNNFFGEWVEQDKKEERATPITRS